MEKYISQYPRISSSIRIISSFPVFTSLQSNWRGPYFFPIIISTKFCMKTRQYALLPTFRNALLKYPYELSCCCIFIVQVKVNEKYILACMTHFNISSLYNYTITLFHHCTITQLRHWNHAIIFVAFFCFHYHSPHVEIVVTYFIFIL